MRIVIDLFREFRVWCSQVLDSAAAGLAGDGLYNVNAALDDFAEDAELDDQEREWRRREQEWMALSPWWM
jgi:hypothetical protein